MKEEAPLDRLLCLLLPLSLEVGACQHTVLGGPVFLSEHQLHVSNRVGYRLDCISSKSLSRSKITLHLFASTTRHIKCKHSHEDQSPCLSLGVLSLFLLSLEIRLRMDTGATKANDASSREPVAN